jgi:DNA-binding NtrC family response regulator
MKNVTVLFVDDEENLLNTFKRLFRRESFNALYASSGQEALEILNNNSVDLMVSDQRMPRMNGVELFKKSKEQFADLKVLLLSGDSDVTMYSAELGEKGLCGVYQKPIDHKKLLGIIYELTSD